MKSFAEAHPKDDDRLRPAIRVAWLTNRAAPYRRPVWESMAKKLSIAVFLLESPSRFRRRLGNRGAEWARYLGEPYPIRNLLTARLVRGESNYYFTFGIPLPLRHMSAVVLGGWESPSYWQALLQAKIFGIATIGFYESTLESQHHQKGVIGAARRRYFQLLDRVVVPGFAAQQAVMAMGVDHEKIVVGFNAVDVVGIHDAVSVIRQLSVIGHKSRGHRYLFIGQFIHRKNLLGLIRSFASIRSDTDKLVLVGKGDLLGSMIKLICELGLEDAVEIRSMVEYKQIPEVLCESHTLVLPSTEEVWGLVVNEALAAGLHVVVTKHCGVAASVDAMQGVYVCQSTSDSLSQAMALSRRSWRGPIENPEILTYTPQKFADVFISTIQSAVQSKRIRRSNRRVFRENG